MQSAPENLTLAATVGSDPASLAVCSCDTDGCETRSAPTESAQSASASTDSPGSDSSQTGIPDGCTQSASSASASALQLPAAGPCARISRGSVQVGTAALLRPVADPTAVVVSRTLTFATKNVVGLSNNGGRLFPEHRMHWLGPLFLPLTPALLGKETAATIPFDTYRVRRACVALSPITLGTDVQLVSHMQPIGRTSDTMPAARCDECVALGSWSSLAPERAGMTVGYFSAQDVRERTMTLTRTCPRRDIRVSTRVKYRDIAADSLGLVLSDSFSGGFDCATGPVEEVLTSTDEHYDICGTCAADAPVARMGPLTEPVFVDAPDPQAAPLRRIAVIGRVSRWWYDKGKCVPTKAETMNAFSCMPGVRAVLPCYGMVQIDIPRDIARAMTVRSLAPSLARGSPAPQTSDIVFSTEYACYNCLVTAHVSFVVTNGATN